MPTDPNALTKAQARRRYATSGFPSGIVGAGRFDPARSTYNANGSTLGRWYAAIQRANNGGAAARFSLLADSIGRGETASNPYNVHSWPYRLNSVFVDRFGDAGLGVDPLIDSGAQNTRYTTAGTWTTDAGAGFNSSSAARTTVTSGSTLTYASPTPALTGLKVWYRVSSDGGSFTYTIDGGAASGPVSTVGTEAIASTTIALTGLGTHSVVLTNGGNTRMTILAIEELVNSGNGGIKVGKYATSGAKTSYFIGNAKATAALQCQTTIGVPDLTAIALMANDYAIFITSIATWKTQQQTLITNAKLTGDVILIITPTPGLRRGADGLPSTGDDVPLGTTPTFTEYRQAAYDLADANGCAVLDMAHAWGTWAEANANGLMADDLHPTEVGHWTYASVVAAAILPTAPSSASLVKRTWGAVQKFAEGVVVGKQGTSLFQIGALNMDGVDLTRPGLFVTNSNNDVYINGQPTGTAMFYFRQFRKLLVDPSTYWQGLNAATSPLAARVVASQTAPILSAQDIGGVHVAGINAKGGLQAGNGAAAGGCFWSGSGAPTFAATLGDAYLRTDTPTTANQRLYVCNTSATTGAGAWTAIL